MNAAPGSLDRSSKRWLAVLAVAVLAFVAAGVHSYFHLRPPPPPVRETPPPPAPPVFHPVPRPVWAPLPLTPAQKETLHQEQVHEQAKYFRDLSARYPKTASLPTPEEIAAMEKRGELAW